LTGATRPLESSMNIVCVIPKWYSATMPDLKLISRPGGVNCRARLAKGLEDEVDTDIQDFEDTIAEYRVFQAREIEKSLAREQRRSRKIMLELDMPRPKRKQAETIDALIGRSFNSEAGESKFAH
jgi:hypothetical protein